LAFEVDAGFFLEGHRAPDCARVDGVQPIEPVSDPSGPRLEQHQFQLRKLVKGSVLEERGEGVADTVAGRDIQEIKLPAQMLPVVSARLSPVRFDSGMYSERHAKLLGLGEERIVIGMRMWLARHHEWRDPAALAPVFGGTFELAGGGLGIAERQMRDRNQPAAAVLAEVHNPPVVGAGKSLSEFDVLAFGFIEEAK